MSEAPSPLVDALTEINITDLLESAGLARWRYASLRHLVRPVARRFALTAHEFDNRVGRDGLAQGSTWLMQQMTAGLRTTGLAHIPAQGPLFILANHPGMTDTVALFASLASRPDLRVIALDRPFLRALPNVSRQLIFLPPEESGRLAVIREGARHLKNGGALLTFPAGDIEPDPAVSGSAQAMHSLRSWSDSYALFARLVPGTRFVPTAVSHVISPAAQRNPLTFLRRTRHGKARLAAALQVALPRYRELVPRVHFMALPRMDQSDPQALCAAVATQMRQHMLALCLAEPVDDYAPAAMA